MPIKKEKNSSTEAQILEAAKIIFTEQGFAGARMQAIADKANINKAMLHYYFRNKEALFGRIMDEIIVTMTHSFIPILKQEVGVMEKVERIINSYIDTVLQNPHIPMFVLNELSQNQFGFKDQLKEKMSQDAVLSNFMMQIVQEQQQGILKPIAPQHFLITMMSLIVFPFIAKPIFTNVMSIPNEMYIEIIKERKVLVLDMMKAYFLK